MSRANLSMFEADLSASWLNLQRILNFYLLRNLASNELFFTYISIIKFYIKIRELESQPPQIIIFLFLYMVLKLYFLLF
ncbi:hypothetical protein CJ209_08190 [Fusobacterium nucleatum]|uniref:Riboflavin synthase subunit alpha n=1 Tax=Fusobacterium nucleatum TaxID=851 RepID=A0A2N6TH80_FUSNU|nr:hypothetical protein CJ209_08190 [Fusobacterium nucleatum]